jgi:hypothetical protein
MPVGLIEGWPMSVIDYTVMTPITPEGEYSEEKLGN